MGPRLPRQRGVRAELTDAARAIAGEGVHVPFLAAEGAGDGGGRTVVAKGEKIWRKIKMKY